MTQQRWGTDRPDLEEEAPHECPGLRGFMATLSIQASTVRMSSCFPDVTARRDVGIAEGHGCPGARRRGPSVIRSLPSEPALGGPRTQSGLCRVAWPWDAEDTGGHRCFLRGVGPWTRPQLRPMYQHPAPSASARHVWGQWSFCFRQG